MVLKIEYSETELRKILEHILTQQQDIYYNTLLQRVKEESVKAGLLEINSCIIPEQDLSIYSKKRIDKVIWELIIEKKIMLNFFELSESILRISKLPIILQ